MATLKELADLVGGTVSGDENLEIQRVAPIDDAQPGDITFIANPKYLKKLTDTKASAVIITPGVEVPGRSLLVCANPYLAFAKVLTHLQVQAPAPKGVMKGATVSETAILGEGVTIHPGAVVGDRVSIGRGTVVHPGVVLYDDVTVGEDCLIHAQVVVREGCVIGNRNILQPSAVIGSDGFGYAPDGRQYYKIPQVGNVVLEDDVEIGAATCIDRAALGTTLIKRGCKIDNLAQIGHNVVVGEDTVMVSQVGIAGSTVVGEHCTLGGQVGVAGHIKIGDNVMVGARGGVTNNVAPNQVVSGFPVIPHKEWLKASKSVTKLPELRKDISRLKKQVEELVNELKEK